MTSVPALPLVGPVTLLVCSDRRVLARKALCWVYGSEAEALFAAGEHGGEPWFLLEGAYSAPDDALRALGGGRVLLSHSARAPMPVPRTGPFLRKCAHPGAQRDPEASSGRRG
jgi:hypothetical protein